MKTILTFALLLVAFCGRTFASAQGESTDHPIQVLSPLETILPSSLKALLLEAPTVRVLVTVGDDGKLVDYLALEAPHHELLDKAEAFVKKIEFRPAVVEGKSIQSSAEIAVSFFDPEQRAFRQGVVAMPFGGSPGDAVARRTYELNKDRFTYQRAEPAQLDQPITLVETKVIVLTDASGQPAHGLCMVEFYVDRKGEPRAPRILKSDNETVSLSALLTLQHTRFKPPTHRGAPTYVRVRQPMSFAPPPENPPGSVSAEAK